MTSNGWCNHLKEQTKKYMKLVCKAISIVEALNGGLQFTPDLLLNLDETGFDPGNNQDLEVI